MTQLQLGELELPNAAPVANARNRIGVVKLLALLLSLVACPAPANPTAPIERTASGHDLASVYKCAANNPVRVTDRNGTIGSDPQFDRSVAGRIDGDAVAASSSPGTDWSMAATLGVMAVAVVAPALLPIALDIAPALTPAATAVGTFGGAIVANSDPGSVANVGPAIVERAAAVAVDSAIEEVSPRNLTPIQTAAEMTMSKIRKIGSDMKANGYRGGPIDVVEAGGKKLITDGHHRAAAAVKAGLSKVPINRVPAGEAEKEELLKAAAEAAHDNALRKN